MELNKKLAEWAGFTQITKALEEGMEIWLEPDGLTHQGSLNFPESLDACFEWLVPKLNGCHIDYLLDSKWCYFATAWIKGRATQCAYESNPALALCLAIEKLIDGGE